MTVTDESCMISFQDLLSKVRAMLKASRATEENQEQGQT